MRGMAEPNIIYLPSVFVGRFFFLRTGLRVAGTGGWGVSDENGMGVSTPRGAKVQLSILVRGDVRLGREHAPSPS
jgi:hypothetical protein